MVLAMLVAPISSLYSQNENTPLTNESAISWSHREYDRTLPKFDSLTMVRDRFYFLGGVVFSNRGIKSSIESLGYRFGGGYNLTPVHSVEMGLNLFPNSTGEWGYSTSSSKVSVDLGYAFSLTNFGSRSTYNSSHYDFQFLAGATIRGGDYPVDLYTGVRASYLIFRNLNAFVEGRVVANMVGDNSLVANNRLTASISAGVSFTLHSPDFYIHEVATPLAVKTNLMYDLIGALNLGLEVPIRRRWSIAVDALFPWYGSRGSHTYYRVHNMSIEGRYWLGSSFERMYRKQLTGWFVGLNAGGGQYDLMFDPDKGAQGTFIQASATGGFAHEIRQNLRLEYSVGVGAVMTNYYKYAWDGFAYQLKTPRSLKYRSTFVIPTKLSVAMVWMLDFNPNKK
ncbi:MAG: DUF3575 domain-containing protein [Rikenellaceae bacterium]